MVLAACGGDEGTGPATVTGTYNLQTVDGAALPYILIQAGADRLEITGGRITLNPDNTFSDRTDYRLIEDGDTSTDSETYFGTYTVNGQFVALEYDDGEDTDLILDGATLTQNFEGLILVYRK
jgi:hypothetical protein